MISRLMIFISLIIVVLVRGEAEVVEEGEIVGDEVVVGEVAEEVAEAVLEGEEVAAEVEAVVAVVVVVVAEALQKV